MEQYYKLKNSINFNQAKFDAVNKNEESLKKLNEDLTKKIKVEKDQNVKIYRDIEGLEENLRIKSKDM